MKKLAVFTLLVLTSFILSACAAQPTPAAPAGVTNDLGGREVRIAVEDAYPPFNSIDEETNESVGWDYDAWRAICERINCTPVFVVAAWDGLFEAMAAEEYDVAADGITILLERTDRVAFSNPYMNIGQVILVRVDERDIMDEDALINMTDKIVGVQLGTTNEIVAMDVVGEERIRSFDTFDLPVLALMSGDVDAVIIDTVAAGGFMAANPDRMKVVDQLTSGELLGFAFPHMSDLIVPVNWAMKEMFADGSMDALCVKWIGTKCDPTTD
ncbi:MAG: transporter substrate-binding domain-containing protein [Anaerolineales bacterium]|nr:transporter substrate-binding domain-containing protein [Anaerolineales bacterium]